MSRNWPELFAGLFLLVLGGAGIIGSLALHIGTASNMGPGYFPLASSLAIFACGLFQLFQVLRAGEASLPRIDWLPLVTISAGGVVYALMISRFGLLPAIVGCTVTCGLFDPRLRVKHLVALCVVLCLLAYLTFVAGLGLPIPSVRLPAWN